MLTNFTLQDLFGGSLAFALFSVIFVAPGYTAGWFLDLFDFRHRTSGARLVIALVVSFGISPILTFLTWSLISIQAAFGVLLGFAAVCLAILLKSRPGPIWSRSDPLQNTTVGIAAGWVILAFLSLLDIQWRDRLYYNLVSYDYATRVAIINAITRTGVPPINPGYFPGQPVALTYLYYFWYIPCSLVEQLGIPIVNARTAMIASSAWCGLALMATVALYLRLRNPAGGTRAKRNALLGSSLLLISGLDVFPALLIMISSRLLNGYSSLEGDLELWNEQITAWVGSVLWVPHHVAAMIACLLGIMLVHSVRNQNASRRTKAMIVAGFAFASAVGLSIYVCLVFVLGWGIWIVSLFLRRERQLSFLMAMAGFVALTTAFPFLRGLLAGSPGSSSGSFPVVFEVRRFLPIIPLVLRYPNALSNLVFLLLLPINYFMELGFFFLGGLLWLQLLRRGEWERNPFYAMEMILLAAAIFIGSLFRSTPAAGNDLGWRAWLPGQFILVIWGVDVLVRFFPDGWQRSSERSVPDRRTSRYLAILVLAGLLTTVTDLVLLRTWPILVDRGLAGFPSSLSPDTHLGERTYAARQAYDFVNLSTPRASVIQYDPNERINRPAGLYANRQMAISDLTAFGVPLQDFSARSVSISQIFAYTHWTDIDAACQRNSINILVVDDLDPLWANIAELGQERLPLYQNPYYAVFACAPPSRP